MKSQPLPVVHIGMPKAASKTLQGRVFAQHSDIFYLGRFDGPPHGRSHQQFDACRDARVQEFMTPVAYHPRKRLVSDEFRASFEQYLQKENPQGRVPVWSWESHCTDVILWRRMRAVKLKSLFVNARVVVVIRHPADLLESAYLQQLKRDNVGGRYRRGKGIFYPSIDRWMSNRRFKDIHNHLEYPRTIGIYTELFGLENVCVLLFEDLKANASEFYRKLSAFMGIDPAETLKLAENRIENVRWSSVQVERLARIKAAGWRKRLQYRFATRNERMQMLGLDKKGASTSQGGRANEKLDGELREKVVASTRQGNLWLQDQFGLDLAQHGYFE